MSDGEPGASSDLEARRRGRFPVGMEKYLTLRNYTLLHNGLQGVRENDPILLANPEGPNFCHTHAFFEGKKLGKLTQENAVLER